LANVFKLSKWIEMNMVEECAVTFGFNKENPRSFPTSSINNQKANPMKPCFKKARGHPKMNQTIPYHILLSKEEKNKC
jgi:hypothetical protein